MTHEIIISKFLSEIISGLKNLSVVDIAKLESGDYSISLKIIRTKGNDVDSQVDTHKIDKSELMEMLRTTSTRDAGYDLLSQLLKTKKELEGFAKFLDVSISKQDKVDQIKEKIVEATIGATLRSNAIQGKIM